MRSLKVTLGMDVPRCKSPGLVRKEVWAHLLAYNLIRAAMARSAPELGCAPRWLSVKGALQAVAAFGERLLGAEGPEAERLYAWLRLTIGSHRVGDRPDRVEPRKRKRRPKHYPFLTRPRQQERKAGATER